MRIEDHELPQRNYFRYIGSINCKDGDYQEIDEDVEHRIKEAWLKWRLASGVFCDQQMLTRLKG